MEINPVTKEPRFRVIGCDLWSDDDGFGPAIAATGITGICGSGIIEVIAEMRLAGIVDASGLIGSADQTGTSVVLRMDAPTLTRFGKATRTKNRSPLQTRTSAPSRWPKPRSTPAPDC